MDRRGVLKGSVLLTGAWAIVARPWTWGDAPDVSFSDMPELPPFRRLAVGSTPPTVSGLNAALVGIPSVDQDPLPEIEIDATELLLNPWEPGGAVPATYFTDIRCPICPEFEARVERLSQTHPIELRTREFPIFGPASELAARSILAASEQQMGEAMRQRLRRSAPLSTDDAALQIAATVSGLDAEAFAEAFGSERITRALAIDRTLARTLRLPGTPALVLGRTVIVGLQPLDVMETVWGAEYSLGPA